MDFTEAALQTIAHWISLNVWWLAPAMMGTGLFVMGFGLAWHLANLGVLR